MPLKKYSLKTTEGDRGKRLDQVLADWLPTATGKPLSKAKVRKLIVAGAVYLNRHRVRIASKVILPNALIEAMIDFVKLEADGRAADRPFEMTEKHILYEDDYLIAVNKPPGLPTQPTLDESRDNLFAALKKFITKRAGGGEVYLGLHHRLDRDTSGIVLFTKAKSVNASVAELFAERQAKKTYLAIVAKPEPSSAPKAWTVKNYLGKKTLPGKKARFQAVKSGGDFAHTEFSVKDKMKCALLVEARPQTGRTHQIRVHLSEGGMPIVGDTHYGDRSRFGDRVMLHALRLEFPHPVTKQTIVIEAELPEDFKKCLERCGIER